MDLANAILRWSTMENSGFDNAILRCPTSENFSFKNTKPDKT
jgi:hypothetical protein